jgi:hypothetical protein
MRHVLWLLSFISAIGFAQSAPEPAAPLFPPMVQPFQVMPVQQKRLPVFIPSSPNQKAPVSPTGRLPFTVPACDELADNRK